MKYPIWKPILLLLVVALCVLLFYPPSQRLKRGIDLAGGTTLTYEVQVPEGRDVETAIEDTIAVLRQRIDPQGVMNLVWRPVAGTRLEVQMPLAGPEVRERLDEYLEAREALLDNEVTPRALNNLVQAQGEQRAAELDRLSGFADRAVLEAVIADYDALQAATPAYEQTQRAFREAEDALDELPASATDEERQSMTAAVEALQAQLIANTEAYLDARDAFRTARDAALEQSISPVLIEAVLAQPDTPGDNGGPSDRQQAFDRLAADYPGKAGEIDALRTTWAAYEAVKGPLDDPNDLKALLRGSGVLEFRIAAVPGQEPTDIARYREQLEERGPNAGRTEAWRWFKIDDVEQFAERPLEAERMRDDPAAYFLQRGMVAQQFGPDIYLLLSNTPGSSISQRDEGWSLAGASRGADQQGLPAINFTLNPQGGALMYNLHRGHVNRLMAIVLDGGVVSAPVLNPPSQPGSFIRERGMISGGRGGFNETELNYLLRTLQAGSLEATLSEDPISEVTFDAAIGADNIAAGFNAAITALVIVAIFMVLYYFGLGVVANLALIFNLCIILGLMSLLNATFTLPGIAGVVLTIGMAVDANVLIFERIREELKRGADTPTAVRIGFDKAFSTIIDANVTTFITCVVLYYTATADIKGFATTLMVGILATLFTSLFGSRVVVEMAMIFGKVRSLPVLPTTVVAIGHALEPKIDWLSKRYLFFVVSAALMIGGIGVALSRGVDMLDIEFRSGTQVSFNLAEGELLPIGEARERLRVAALDADRPLIAEANVVAQASTGGQGAAGFNISTLDQDANEVSEVVKAAFAGLLETTRPLEFTGVEVADVELAPIFPVMSPDLGQSIDRPGLGLDVEPFVGGVAVVLEGVEPLTTVEDVAGRVERMRSQPGYEGLGYRPMEVLPLGASIGVDEATGEPTYDAFVVVSREPEFSYADAPDAFGEAGGLAATEWALVRDALTRDTSLDSVSSFSSQVSRTMQQQAIVAMSLSLLAVVAYIWIRFGSIRYGIAAIVALVHDVSITLGLVAISGWLQGNTFMEALLLDPFKINIAMVAAMLTIVGYSLNDTIVVFDRIRENRGRMAQETPEIINRSINQTISRTVLTSGTTLIAILTLYILGGPGVHGFAFAMLIGVAVGTYSSVAIASPLLVLLGGTRETAESSEQRVTPTPA
ncbi:MAG: protein translocase subunit SecD [Planctomycetota bacterium]